MFVSKNFSFFFVCMLTVCGNSISQTENASQTQPNNRTENLVQTASTENDNSFVTMSRSSCFGNCPVYNLTIQLNGKVVFEGVQYTKVKGKIESNLSKQKVNELIEEIDKADYYSFKNSYQSDSNNCPEFRTDAPNVILSINLRGKEKTILHNYGCQEKSEANTKVFPQQLYNLEDKIDEIVETKRWIGESK